ncbi:hypothetical protein AX16_001137 [Volvariella volvacea WC 439]|nr:hypothetical protein AX16_001137 [Volvariella volvacea WC 439]
MTTLQKDMSIVPSGDYSFYYAPAEITISIASYLDTSTLTQLRYDSPPVVLMLKSPHWFCKMSQSISHRPCLRALRFSTLVHTSPQPLQMRKEGSNLRPLCYNRVIHGPSFTYYEVEISLKDKQKARALISEIQEGIAEAVLKATIGGMKGLEIDLSEGSYKHCYTPASILQFKSLCSFKFALDEFGRGCDALNLWGDVSVVDPASHHCIPEDFKKVIRTLIGNNKHLDELYISQGCAVDLHDASTLFRHAGGGAERQPLLLHTFTMKGVQFSHPPDPLHSPFTNLQHLRVHSVYSILPLNNLWLGLQASGTTLKTLLTSQVSHPLTSYLASYSGLQELSIQNIEDIPAWTSSKVIMTFFEIALLRHAPSLTSLSISYRRNIQYLEGWSFTPSLWMPALKSLKALKFLGLPPEKSDNISLSSLMNSDDDTLTYLDVKILRQLGPYQNVLDNVCQLGKIETLQLFWPKEVLVVGLDKWIGLKRATRSWRGWRRG